MLLISSVSYMSVFVGATRTTNEKVQKARAKPTNVGEGILLIRLCISMLIRFPAKGKRAPSAYNNFVKQHLKEWKAANPDKAIKEGMAEVSD